MFEVLKVIVVQRLFLDIALKMQLNIFKQNNLTNKNK